MSNDIGIEMLLLAFFLMFMIIFGYATKTAQNKDTINNILMIQN